MHTSDENKKKDKPVSTVGLVVYIGLGISLCLELVVAAGLGWWIGNFLDAKYSTKPWGMLFFLLLFLTAGIVHMIRVLTKVQDRLSRED